jgi:hypothetical protein
MKRRWSRKLRVFPTCRMCGETWPMAAEAGYHHAMSTTIRRMHGFCNSCDAKMKAPPSTHKWLTELNCRICLALVRILFTCVKIVEENVCPACFALDVIDASASASLHEELRRASENAVVVRVGSVGLATEDL